MPDDWVEIEHPKVKNAPPGRVTRHAYQYVWKQLGWRIVKPKEEEK